MIGTVQSVEILDGQYGKYTRISIDGQSFQAYKGNHLVASVLHPGDKVDYTTIQKGQYTNLASIRGADPAAVSGPSVSSVPTPPGMTVSKEEGVLVSYAKDLMVAKPEISAEEAVNDVFVLVALVKKGMKANPT